MKKLRRNRNLRKLRRKMENSRSISKPMKKAKTTLKKQPRKTEKRTHNALKSKTTREPRTRHLRLLNLERVRWLMKIRC